MITFIHTADIHFGMENYGKVDPITGIHSRLLDFNAALTHCIDYALDKKVDFFLFCGDAYKTAHPSQTQQRLLMQCFMRLYKAGIPVVIIVGNHDHPLSFGKANALDIFGDLPLDGFHVISKPTTLILNTKNGIVQILGIPWPTRNTASLRQVEKSASKISEYISQAVTHIIKDMAAALDPDLPAILAGHLTVSSGIFSGSEKRAVYGNDPTFLPSQLAIKPFDYVALGHLHRHQNLNLGGVPVVYSGSIERVDFGERKESKGFCLVTLDAKFKTNYEFIEVPTRPFIQIEVHLENSKPQTDQIIHAIRQHAIQDAVVKIIYHIPEGKPDYVDLKAIQKECAPCIHLVGIIPLRSQIIRQRRMGATKLNTDMRSLLQTYFETKPELKNKENDLIEMALHLMDEAQKETD